MLSHKKWLPTATAIPQEILAGILSAINPEKIICFGTRSNIAEAWSCFLSDIERETTITYDLLILTRPNEKRPRHELLDIVDALNTKAVQLNALIHSVVAANEALANGSMFFTRVVDRGILLYDNQNVSLNPHAESCYPPDTSFAMGGLCCRSFDLARKFLAGASHFFDRGVNDLSAFMLHQAVEHTCIALTRTITGYRPNTHSLKRLITLMDNYAPFSAAIFPRNTREEIHLFTILSRSYSEARYNEVYSVTQQEVRILIDRVSAFQSHAESVYKRMTQQLVSLKV